MPSKNSRTILRMALLCAVVLILVDLALDLILISLFPATDVAFKVVALKDAPLAVAYVAFLFFLLRRELKMRAAAEGEWQAADARLQIIMDNLPAATAYLDRDGRYVSANAGYQRLMGFDPAAIIGRPFREVMPPATSSVGEPHFQSALAGETQVFENMLPRPDGGAFPALVQLVPDRRDDRVVGVHILLTDISPLREAEEALAREQEELRQSREQLRTAEAAARAHANELQALLDAVPAAIFLARDPQATVITGSDLAYQLLRLPKGSNLSKSAPAGEQPQTFRVMHEGVELAPDQLPVQIAAATGEAVRNYEVDLLFEDGEVISLIGNAGPLFDEHGQPCGAIGAFADVTMLKRAEAALRMTEATARQQLAELLESQELMRRALDVGRGFAFQYRMRSDQVVRSPESARILGLPEGPGATKDTGPAYFQRVHPQDRPRYVARVLGLTPESDSYRTTYRIVRPDGKTIIVEESARGLFDEEGTLIQVFGITQDVTERVQAEQERERLLQQVQAQQTRLSDLARDLQVERDIMATIMENTRTQLAYLDPEFRFVKVNSAYAAGAGKPVEALLGQGHFALFPNDQNRAIFEHVRNTGQPVEYRARPFNYAEQPERGTTYWDWTLVPVKDAAGQVSGMVFSLSDVTEQKRAEEVLRTARDELQQRVGEATAELCAVVTSLEEEIAERERAEALLRDSEARLRLLVEQVPAVLWTTDRELRYTSSEGAGLAAIGAAPGQLVGQLVASTPSGNGRSGEIVIAAHRRALAGESVTYRAQWAGAYFEGYIEPLRDADGEIIGCIGVALDITERIRSEEAQREREQQYRNIFESTSDGMVIIDPTGQILDANPAAVKMSGYEHAEFVRLDSLTFIRSDYRELLGRFFQAVMSGRRLERQVIGLRKDGSEFDLELRASEFQYGGKPHVLAVLRDVTERVRSFQLLEQRVRERTRELSALLAFSRQASATLEVRPLMELVVEEVSRLVDSTGVSLLLLQGETLRMAAHRGRLPASIAEQVRVAVNEPGLRAMLLNNPTPIVLSDVQMEGQQAEAIRRAGGVLLDQSDVLHSIMWVPLVVQQKLIGGLGIAHTAPGRYSEREAGLVQAIASQAAVAIENARLYEQAHELAVMHERQRLARELHDSVTQSLYSLSLMAEAARRLVAAGNKDKGIGYLARIGESAQQVLKEMRLLVYELRPLMLERDGLASALKQRLETVEGRAGVETKLVVEGPGLLPENIETELYRIAQEALNNSLKHSSASSVAVLLQTKGDPISLTIQDNGRGFSPEEIADKGGLGLVSMQERAQRLGGRVEVMSAPGEGVTITATIPLSGNPRK